MPNEVMKSLTIGANTYDLPTKTSDLTNDSGYTTFSGSYNDLTNKPTIHTYSAGNGIDITNDAISAKNVMYVTFTVTYNDSNDTYIVSNVSKTFSEIYTHLQNNGIAIALDSNYSNEHYYVRWYSASSITFQSLGDVLADECYLNMGNFLHIFSDNTFDYTNTAGGYMPYLYLNGAQTQHLPNFYAPTTSGTSGQILKSNGNGQAPTWTTLNVESPITYTNDTIGFDGYDITITTTTLCNETVTTAESYGDNSANLNYSTQIAADPLKITFNGIEYICPRQINQYEQFVYGGTASSELDFSQYPFILISNGYSNILYTKNAGTYTIKIESVTNDITVSSDFAIARGYSIIENPSQVLVNESTTTTELGTVGYGTLSYFSESNDVIKVTFNNVEYICPKYKNEDYYGAPGDSFGGGFDFSTYPFQLKPNSSNNNTSIITQTAGTYVIKIETYPTVAILTNDFKQAVKSSFLGNVMIQGVDYVTAGQQIGSSLGSSATAEGYSTTASGNYSHAEGSDTTASGVCSHTEGGSTTASGSASHAEGTNTTASKEGAHAEGRYATASGSYSHAEGNYTTASGETSHAEGSATTASGAYSHAEGWGSTANHKSQHVFGEYNVLDTSTANANSRGNYVEIVGKGTGNSARSNARTLDWNGNEVLAGKLTVGTAPTANMDVATKKYVDDATSSHTHGNITNGGDITTNVTIASGDRIVINDESTSKITNSSITFGTSTTQYLANNGTWQSVPTAPVTSVNGNVGAITGLQTTSNLVTSVSSSSTNSQYPSAKLFYDTVGNIEALLAAI